MFAWLARRLRASSAAMRQALVVVICLVLLLTGCLTKQGPREDETTMDFRHIARAYEAIQSFHNRPPRDLDEIKKYLADFHTDKLVDEPEKVLTSSRDGLPYVIVIGAQIGAEPTDAIVFYEQKGSAGQRYVMTSGRVVRQMPDEEFRRAKFAQGHRPEIN
jgi:hypothetical protein